MWFMNHTIQNSVRVVQFIRVLIRKLVELKINLSPCHWFAYNHQENGCA